MRTTTTDTSHATVTCAATPGHMAMMAPMGLGRRMWSLEVHIPNAHDSSSIVDASHLRCGQPKKKMSLANIAEDAIWACSVVTGSSASKSGTHAQFTTRFYTTPGPGRVQLLDRELEQALAEVKGRAKDEQQFQDWQSFVIESHRKKRSAPKSITE